MDWQAWLRYEGAALRAGRLFGAVAVLCSAAGLVITPPEQEGYMRDAAAARARLDTATWEGVWAEGQAMTLEQVLADALDEVADG